MLLVLATAGVVFMGWYIKAGHNWNMAATTIDDRFGQMDGYVAILYKGTNEPTVEEKPRTSRTLAIQTEAEREIELRERAAMEDALLERSRVSYQDKGANVLVIDAQNPQQYAQPSVLIRNGYHVGVFSVNAETPYLSIDRALTYFTVHEVNIVVVLEESPNEYAESVSGINIVIPVGNEPVEPDEDEALAGQATPDSRTSSSGSSVGAQSSSTGSASAGSRESGVRSSASSSQQAGVSGQSSSSGIVASGETDSEGQPKSAPVRSNAFFLKYFDRGEIGVILISPNNLVSSKTISE